MNIVRKMEHESSIDAEVLYTSYKWNLRQWSLLSEHYKNGVTSPEFDITGFAECKCKLTLNSIKPTLHNQYQSPFSAYFIGKIDCCLMQLTLSITDKDMRKLSTYKTVTQGHTQGSFPLDLSSSVFDSTESKSLQNDTLILLFEVKIVTTIRDLPITTTNFTPNDRKNTLEVIDELYKSKHLCDVVFSFENTEKTLKAHKLVLAANSRVFRAMFTNDTKEQAESVVNIEGIDVDLFEIFLNFMYAGKVTEMENVVEEMIIVADKYEVLNLLEMCETYMVTHLNDENAIDYLITAHRYSCTTLENKAIQYIKSNTRVLAKANNVNLFSEFPSLLQKIFS